MALGDGIRRNVATVSDEERRRLRDAIIELHRRFYPGNRTESPAGGVSFWFKQDEIHQATHVHGGPAFLPWHRELCNRLEALIREVDPELSLHYWDWTTDPRPLLTQEFMGSPSGAAGEPWLSAGFYSPGATPFRSDNPFDPVNNNPADPPRSLTRDVAPGPPPVGGFLWPTDGEILSAATYPEMRDLLERAHDRVHGYIGGSIGNAHTSFRDPFVFLLHSNVDRLFAMWQTPPGQEWRLDPAQVYGTETNDPEIIEDMEPWASTPPFPGRVKPVRPWAAPESQPEVKTCRHPSVVKPPRYDTMFAGRIMVADFSSAQVPPAVPYWESWGDHPLFNGWQDDNDWTLVGDFMRRGYDQLLSVNRNGSGGRIMVADFSGTHVPPVVRYWEDWAQHPLFNGWQDDEDRAYVGDFMHFGYDQLLSVNRDGSGGRIMVADFSAGRPPAVVHYWERWGEHPLFNGWQDDNDWALVGDFMHLGYDQLLSVNRDGSGGRIMIADFSGGQVPAQVRYWEDWGQHPLFNGWQDDNDWMAVGDFMHLGYDQLLSVNRTNAGDGRIMIADFSAGAPPAQVRYWETWGDTPLFNGWQDDNDWTLIGDFMRRGYDQLLSVNRNGSGGRIMVADFSGTHVPPVVRYWEDWGQHPLFNGWQDDNDWTLVGDFMHLGYDQLLSVNRTP